MVLGRPKSLKLRTLQSIWEKGKKRRRMDTSPGGGQHIVYYSHTPYQNGPFRHVPIFHFSWYAVCIALALCFPIHRLHH